MFPKRLAAVLVLLIFTLGCAGTLQTPQDRSDFAMSYWVAQKADYTARYEWATMKQEDGTRIWKPETTNLEKDILRTKYQFIVNAEEPIALYDSYVQAGQIPPAELEMMVMQMINDLKQYLVEHQKGG